MNSIFISQTFNAPQDEIFAYLCDHNNLGAILGAQILRIKDADSGNPNGVGSVRSIKIGVELLQETVVTFDEPDLIEYKISSNAPINYHLGCMEFSTPAPGKTQLNYTIDLESKIGIIDGAVGFILKTVITNGLKKLAAKYN
ncbi:MAG TPA: SRPBCC family protein [Chitinophagales bacterium]|nr:SRPBCC family protein [Chitinophagales bacterium]HMW11960.1 SRPBCC family protein [Chitinophagales bacterium]HMX59586.1 SRPBCC family protein [Chitinophagales bacterium]HMY23246.1 SRPBCC family protein [Chitinophagales bacterium]HMZ33047.1 SRPBCC family protein [Chitinophagales bacterium]